MLKSYKIYTCTNGALGLHLSRAPWDPYPWVSSIQKDSTSYKAGLRIGDCLLELNGQDVLGMKICQIAALLKNHWLNESSNYVTAVIWRNKCNSYNNNDCNEGLNDGNNDDDNDDDDNDDEDGENNAHNINQQSLQKFATCLQHIAQLLECPVCLEVIKPPGWQCCNGHVLCNNCRSRSEKCPVCRVPLGPRGRCLLSDKLFTLLADSFPCDGVRSNRNSPKERRKCSTDFHNQPKMSILQKQQQQQQEKNEQQGAKKAKDFIFTSLTHHRRRKVSNSKTYHDDSNDIVQAGKTKEENKHPSMQKQVMYDINTAVVVNSNIKRNSSDRKSSADYNSEAASIVKEQPSEANVKGVATFFCYNKLQEQTSTIQRCHCIKCFKLDKVTVVNNVATATTGASSPAVNKYILRIPSQEKLVNVVQQQQQQYEEKYKNYQCPTGKLCCLNVNVMPHESCGSKGTSTITTENYNNKSATNNNLNTPFNSPITMNNLPDTLTGHPHQLQNHPVNDYKFFKILKNEWEILAHLTEDHQMPVTQYYAQYGQSLRVQDFTLQHSIICLNLRGSDENNAKVEKFFLACIPLEMSSTTTASIVAIFMYHINSLANDTATIAYNDATSLNDEVSNFETIIENPLTGIKWFGHAHPLTTPWSYIHEKQHFLRHNVLQNPLAAVTKDEAAFGSGDDALMIVVKRKLEIKP